MSFELIPFEQPWLQTASALAVLVLLAFAANWIAKQVVLRLIRRGLALSPLASDQTQLGDVVARLTPTCRRRWSC